MKALLSAAELVKRIIFDEIQKDGAGHQNTNDRKDKKQQRDKHF